MRLEQTCLASLLLVSQALAGEIRIPTDQPDLQAALVVAVAGDVILVQTDADQGGGAIGLQITVPVTIVGDPICNVTAQSSNDGRGFVLAGPGFGEVVLMNTTVGYSSPDSNGIALFEGTGFDGLRLYQCDIVHDNFQVTGKLTVAEPSLSLPDIQELTIVGCNFLGGAAGADWCSVPYGPDGGAGLYAPNAYALIIDSTIEGGRGGSALEVTDYACPPDLSVWGGKGGDGVVAAQVDLWNSQVTFGRGATWNVLLGQGGCGSPTFYCGVQPDGNAYVVGGAVNVTACSRLTQPTAIIELGGTWTLDWNPATVGCLPAPSACDFGCTGYLFVHVGFPTQPFQFFNDLVFLNPSTAVLLDTFQATGAKQWNFFVPAIGLLQGLPLTAQVAMGGAELSGPLSTVIR